MTAPTLEPRKTDYFGTFLDALSRGAKGVSSGATTADAAGTVASGVSQASAEGDGRDAAIRAIFAHGSEASFGDVMVPPLNSIGMVISVLQELETFGLVERDGGIVRLTSSGKIVAQKLGAASG